MAIPIEIYTDGSYRKPNYGSWCYTCLLDDMTINIVAGGEAKPETTINRMELMAILFALQAIDEENQERKILIYSDSKYCVDAIEKWMKKWQRSGWKTKDDNNVKNRDLFEALSAELKRFKDVTCIWVRGHSGDPGNEIADHIARTQTMRMKCGNKLLRV